MSSCNCMLSGTEIATYTGTNSCDDHAKLVTHFTKNSALSLANAILVFQVDM